MDYYSINQNKNKFGAPASPPLVGNRQGRVGSAPAAGSKVGALEASQLSDDQWGTGQTFQNQARRGVIEALKGSFTGGNEADYQGMDKLRSYYMGALDQLPQQQSNAMSQVDTNSQRGLANLLRQHNNQTAGTGRLGSRQYAGAAGDITSRVASQYMQGMNNAREQSLAQAMNIGSGMGALQQRDLAERNFQNQQAQSLASALERQQSMEAGRQSELSNQSGGTDWGAIAGAVGGIAGTAIGGPMGGMVGSQLGSGLGGALSGSKGGGGGGGGQIPWYMLMNQQSGGKGAFMPDSTPVSNSGYLGGNYYKTPYGIRDEMANLDAAPGAW